MSAGKQRKPKTDGDSSFLGAGSGQCPPGPSRGSEKTYQYWVATCPVDAAGFLFATGPYAHSIGGVRGQLEQGEGGLVHYQVLIRTTKPLRRGSLSKLFPKCHLEPSRSDAAREYVWKEETRIGEPFEWGDTLPPRRNSSHDWETIRKSAQAGSLELVPPDIYVRYYSALRRISSDFVQPPFREVSVKVFWGDTGSGKSHTAWEEAGVAAYSKDPTTKWWDGYSVNLFNLGSSSCYPR